MDGLKTPATCANFSSPHHISERTGVQNSSTALTLKADGTMTGALTGNWSYDATKKQLKLGNVIVCVEREVDWEATPRRVTFVYAGTEKNLNATYWGKKKK